MIKWILDRKIHFLSIATFMLGLGIVLYLDQPDAGWFGLGGVIGGTAIGLLCLQVEDIQRRESGDGE